MPCFRVKLRREQSIELTVAAPDQGTANDVAEEHGLVEFLDWHGEGMEAVECEQIPFPPEGTHVDARDHGYDWEE